MGLSARCFMAKLGNMRKEAEFIVYPKGSHGGDNFALIQSDKRIARVNLETKTAMLSDGKGGHQGFHKISPLLGAKEVPVPDEVINKIQEILSGNINRIVQAVN